VHHERRQAKEAEREAARQRFIERLSDWDQPGAITFINPDGTPVEFDAEGRPLPPGAAELRPEKS